MATGSGQSAASNVSSSSSHMLKTGRRGNPFCKDTHDLFATLMVSLTLCTNTRFFRSYPNTFTTDDAAANLASLRFSQSNRTPDPNDPSRIITTTTTTTFSMTRDIAKGICQHFLDARLIENVVDPEILVFKDRGIFGITPKGLHVLERFITKNGIAADHIVRVFAAQPILVHLINLERRAADDEIDLSRKMLEYVWRRFSGGKHPNYAVSPTEAQRAAKVGRAVPLLESIKDTPGFERSRGVELQDSSERTGGKEARTFSLVRQVFNASSAVEWMVDFSTCVSRDEAAELVAHFVRLGLIVLHADKSKPGDKLVVVEARAIPSAKGPADEDTNAEFRWGPRITYRFTDEGRKLAGSDQPPPLQTGASAASIPTSKALEPKGSSDGAIDDDSSSVQSGQRGGKGQLPNRTGGGLTDALDVQLMSRRLVDLFRGDVGDAGNWAKEQHSSTARLKAILDEPALRALFREYLRSNYCEENLGFWLDVADFRRRFSTTSSATGGTQPKSSGTPGRKEQASASSAMEVHQQHLVSAAMQIYQTYLAPLSPNELNIDHNLRADVVNFINKAALDNAQSGTPALTLKSSRSPPGSRNTSAQNSPDPGVEPESAPLALRATQVQALLRHYERIQDHIFRLLATDQVPKFVRTPRFVELLELSVRRLFYLGKRAQCQAEGPRGAEQRIRVSLLSLSSTTQLDSMNSMDRDSTLLSYYTDDISAPQPHYTQAKGNFELSMRQAQDTKAAGGWQQGNTGCRQPERPYAHPAAVVRPPAQAFWTPDRDFNANAPPEWQQASRHRHHPEMAPVNGHRLRSPPSPPRSRRADVPPPLAIPRNPPALTERSPAASHASGRGQRGINPPRAAFASPASAFASPSSVSLASSSPRSDEKRLLADNDGLAGPDNDRLAPAGGEKDEAFWKRFSMVVHEAQATPRHQKQSSGWLSRQTARQRSFKIAVVILALIILGAIGGALGYHFTHQNKAATNGSDNPTVHDFTFTHSGSGTATKPPTRTLPVGGGGAQQPTGSILVKRLHRRPRFDQ